MAPGKRRKLETEANTQTMSAFALRKKLLAQQTTIPPSQGDQEVVSSDEVDTPVRRRKGATDGSPPLKSSPPGRGRPRDIQTESSGDRPPLSRDSTQYGTIKETKVEKPRGTRTIQHSTFKPNNLNCKWTGDGTVALKLPEGERLVVLGSYGIQVQSGETTVAGAVLRPSSNIHWVHAPHCHALPVLRCSEGSSIELRQNLTALSLRRLERLAPVFANLWNENLVRDVEENETDTFQIIYTAANAPNRAVVQDLISPGEWNRKITELATVKQPNALAVFICGPKSSGKSTLSRLLANRLMTDSARKKNKTWPGVAILDIDPGQPEFSTSGNVSLVHIGEPNLSPPFCHPFMDQGSNRILRSHALASVSPAADPEHYIDCVLDLYAVYQRRLKGRCPLLVNTPGWVQGTGLDLLCQLVAKLHPTEVLYMSQEGPDETVENLRAAAKNCALTELPSQPSEYTSRTARHLRTMHSMSYFHLDLSTPSHDGFRWNATPLTAIPPWSVQYGGSDRGVFAVMCYDYQPPLDLLAEAINGTMVSIVEVEDRAAFRGLHVQAAVNRPLADTADSEMVGETTSPSAGQYAPKLDIATLDATLVQRSPEGLPFIQNSNNSTLDPRYSQNIGTALIRGIDAKKGQLQVLCPLPLERLRQIAKSGSSIVLVSGKLDAPSWAYTEDIYRRSFDSSGADGDLEEYAAVTDADTEDDESENMEEDPSDLRDQPKVPWIETLHGNQRRAVGSRVWRIRRDLGKGGNAAD